MVDNDTGSLLSNYIARFSKLKEMTALSILKIPSLDVYLEQARNEQNTDLARQCQGAKDDFEKRLTESIDNQKSEYLTQGNEELTKLGGILDASGANTEDRMLSLVVDAMGQEAIFPHQDPGDNGVVESSLMIRSECLDSFNAAAIMEAVLSTVDEYNAKVGEGEKLDHLDAMFKDGDYFQHCLSELVAGRDNSKAAVNLGALKAVAQKIPGAEEAASMQVTGNEGTLDHRELLVAAADDARAEMIGKAKEVKRQQMIEKYTGGGDRGTNGAGRGG